MHFSLDRTGYPYVAIPRLGIAFSLLPVTKYQLENWLCEPSAPGDAWYLEVLAVGGARLAKPHIPNSPSLLGAFANGLTATETVQFARWLGPAFRLPTESEWKTAYEFFQPDLSLGELPSNCAPEVNELWAQLCRLHGPIEERLMFVGGFAEWVSADFGYGLLGRPRNTAFPTWGPRDRPAKPVPDGDRDRLVGARIVYSITGVRP